MSSMNVKGSKILFSVIQSVFGSFLDNWEVDGFGIFKFSWHIGIIL